MSWNPFAKERPPKRKKYKSDFVLRMEKIDKLVKKIYLWDSSGKNTYVRAKHGPLLSQAR